MAWKNAVGEECHSLFFPPPIDYSRMDWGKLKGKKGSVYFSVLLARLDYVAVFILSWFGIQTNFPWFPVIQ